MEADLDYGNVVADIVDSVDDLAVALVDDKVDYYCIDWGLDLDMVVVDFDVFFHHHLQAQKNHSPGEEGEPYHINKDITYRLPFISTYLLLPPQSFLLAIKKVRRYDTRRGILS